MYRIDNSNDVDTNHVELQNVITGATTLRLRYVQRNGSVTFSPGHRRQRENTQTREVRFPSSQLTSDSFVRIDSWHQDRVAHHSRFEALCCGWRTWSRRRQLILASVVVLLLILIASAMVVLILLLVRNNGGGNNYHNNVLSTSTPSPRSPTSAPPSPFLQCFVTQTRSSFHNLSMNLTSLNPEVRDYEFEGTLIGFSMENKTVAIYSNNTFQLEENLKVDTMGCQVCQLLSTTINCCSSCPNLENTTTLCSINGTFFQTSNQVVELEVTENGRSLFLTTFSGREPCTLQSYLVNSTTSLVMAGPTRICPNVTDIRLITATTLYIEGNVEGLDQRMVILDGQGQQHIYDNQLNETLVHYNLLNQTALTMRSTLLGEHLLVAIITNSSFYVTRQNIYSGCVTTLAGQQQKFSYDGDLRGGDWIQDQLYLWLVEPE
ncbi:unnamed protein product [Caenorhabditis auriculariae]|uniref:Uncharacterized protein n=1 Tax=Caenorhabditis auriculariae TaxID=2777116 RepID=A0A8S1HTN2_9PELO|nr:unnamed protein product [Caenorhabditis auriculariae]